MGAGISFFRWSCKRQQLIENRSSPVHNNVSQASAYESDVLPESPVVQIAENIVSVQEITNDPFIDNIHSNGLHLITDSLSPAKYQLLHIVTPRGDEEMQVGVPDTPIGDEAILYKYYCPLCMLHFKKILKTKCCNNYICLACCMDYITTKGVERKSDMTSTLAAAASKLEKIHCPNCSTFGFRPFPVSLDDLVRDYSRDNAEQRILSMKNVSAAYQASPVRRGESFEDLKRKMIPYGGGNTLAGIADVITPISSETAGEEQNKRVEENEDEPVVVRRLDFDEFGSESPSERQNRIEALNRNVNLVATSMMTGIFANAVHK